MLKNKKYVVLIVVVFLSLGLVLSGCGGKEDEKLSKLEEIQKEGKIVLGTAADYPPYEFHKQINGEDHIVGFDIKIAEKIAENMGVELEIKDMKFNGLLAALKAGNIDFIVAGMVPTEERAKSVDFSKKYYKAEQKFLTKAGKGSEYKAIEDLSGLKVGAQKATVQQKIVKEKIDTSDTKFISKITDLVLELKNDKIDGVVLVKPVANAYAEANEDLEMAELSLGQEDGIAIAVQQETPELLKEINKTLDQLLNENKITEYIQEATKMAENN